MIYIFYEFSVYATKILNHAMLDWKMWMPTFHGIDWKLLSNTAEAFSLFSKKLHKNLKNFNFCEPEQYSNQIRKYNSKKIFKF